MKIKGGLFKGIIEIKIFRHWFAQLRIIFKHWFAQTQLLVLIQYIDFSLLLQR